MRFSGWTFVAVLSTVVACDCGAPDTNGGDAGDSGYDGPTPQTLCDDSAERQCDYFARCHAESIDGVDFAQGRPNGVLAVTEKDKCVALLSDREGCAVLSESWELGRIELDKDAYLACIDAAYPA